jgi:hypothetical protein
MTSGRRRDVDEMRQLLAGQARARRVLAVVGVALGVLVVAASVASGFLFPERPRLLWLGVLSVGSMPLLLVVLLAGVLRGKTAQLNRALAARQAIVGGRGGAPAT